MKEENERRERNRTNARRSTGPRTRAGKRISRLNALKTGITSPELLLPGERRRDLEVLDSGLRQDLRPVGMAEKIIVDRIVVAEVRRRRIEAAERSLLYTEVWDRVASRTRRAVNVMERELGAFRVDLGEDAATDEERRLPSYERTLAEDAEVSAIRDGKSSDLGVAYMGAMDALDSLARHRTAVERSIERSMHELIRLQDRRLGGDAPVPLAVDVTITRGSDAE